MTKPCQLWVRSLGSNATKIRVIDAENAKWLREKLRGNGVECTDPMELGSGRFFAFRALHVNQMDHAKLMTIIKKFPEIELMFEPA